MGMGAGTKSLAAMVLVLGLVVEQHIQVQAFEVCCPSTDAKAAFAECLSKEGLYKFALCAVSAGCKLVAGKCRSSSSSSPIRRQSPLYSDSDDVAAANAVLVEFCKSGCTSSVCDNNVKTDVVGNKQVDEANDVVNSCGDACFRFCTNHVHVANAVAATNVS